MNIILTDFMAEYLLGKLAGDEAKFAPAKKIIDQINDWWKRDEEIKNCKHKVGHYKGKKDCCVYCGTFFKEGQGESWELEEQKEGN